MEGSRETSRLTAELFRTVISQQRVTSAALVEVVRDIGQQLIAANPVGMYVFSSLLISFCFQSRWEITYCFN